tara:strand:- start:52 stop:282 length:231 start_codon:yes stop_codon:yes gene_type:complete
MSTSDPKKVLKQLCYKVGKKAKFKKQNLSKERKHGNANKKCILCGSTKGHIGKYGLNVCRQCFRDEALNLGFKKYS